jgi:hypothetical protein
MALNNKVHAFAKGLKSRHGAIGISNSPSPRRVLCSNESSAGHRRLSAAAFAYEPCFKIGQPDVIRPRISTDRDRVAPQSRAFGIAIHCRNPTAHGERRIATLAAVAWDVWAAHRAYSAVRRGPVAQASWSALQLYCPARSTQPARHSVAAEPAGPFLRYRRVGWLAYGRIAIDR